MRKISPTLIKIFAAAALASLLAVSCSGVSSKRIYCVAQEGNDLAALLKESKMNVTLLPTRSEALSSAKPGSVVMLLDGRCTLTEEDLETLRAKDLRLYAEMATLPGQEAVADTVNLERVVVTRDLCDGLAGMDLLSINRSAYLNVKADFPANHLADEEPFPRSL